jgi:hypothetical protein
VLEIEQEEEEEIEQEEEEDIDAEETNPCRGQKIEWVPGSVWETYAYAQHDSPFIGWTPIGFIGSKYIKIRSTSCRRALQTFQEIQDNTCSQCSNLRNSEELTTFMTRAAEGAVPRTPWIYLTARQIKAMLIKVRKKLRRMQLEVHIHIKSIILFLTISILLELQLETKSRSAPEESQRSSTDSHDAFAK